MKIIVIDDENDLLEIMKFNFEDMGHEVSTFSDLNLAKTALQSGDFDYLILDFYMPKMNGYDFLLDLSKSINVLPKVIIYSGNFDIQEKFLSSDELAIDKVFRKPLGLDDLFNYINNQ